MLEYEPKIGLYRDHDARHNLNTYAATDDFAPETHVAYTLCQIPSDSQVLKMRAEFKRNFVGITRHVWVAKWAKQGKLGGLDQEALEKAQRGIIPDGYIFARILPATLGGDNSENNMVLIKRQYKDLIGKNFWEKMAAAGRGYLRQNAPVGEKEHSIRMIVPRLSSKAVRAEDVLNFIGKNKTILDQAAKESIPEKKKSVRVVTFKRRDGEVNDRIKSHHMKCRGRGSRC